MNICDNQHSRQIEMQHVIKSGNLPQQTTKYSIEALKGANVPQKENRPHRQTSSNHKVQECVRDVESQALTADHSAQQVT